MAKYYNEIEINNIEEELESQMRKYKRSLKRRNNIEGYEKKAPKHHNRRQNFDDIDAQYAEYMRTGCVEAY